jgi:hypothetical protein
MPGEFSDWARGIVFNEADSENVRLYMYVDNVEGEACPKINLDVRTGHAANGADSEQQFVVYSGLISGITGAENRKEITGGDAPKVFNAPNYLPPNTSAVIQQRVQLDPSATEAHQGTCTWDEVFVAEVPAVVED